MQFHEYRTLRNQQLLVDPAKYGLTEAERKKLKSFSSAEWRQMWIADINKTGLSDNLYGTSTSALVEDIWVDASRPYYNVWPLVVGLSRNVTLDLAFANVGMPYDAMLLRFAKGHEPYGVRVALVFWPKGEPAVAAYCYQGEDWHRIIFKKGFKKEQHVQAFLDDVLAEVPDQEFGADANRIGETIIRLCVFISLLAGNNDLITPVVLSKDREKYEATTDNEVKRWLEDRAARRAGRGFDVGKELQLAKDTSPHWRNPHLCLFWTGEGRTVPVIKLRSGAIIQSVSMAEVPTGYLGPETGEDDNIGPDKTPRESFSKSRRFAILKRDNYRCRLCGNAQEAGAKLHIDHRIPLAKGGSNEDENLWTLCEDCNLGKSDSDL